MTRTCYRNFLGAATVAASLLGVAACGGVSNSDTPDASTTPPVDAPAAPVLTLTEVAARTFTAPESVLWDADAQAWYVSNLGQPFQAAEVPGFISKIPADGTVTERWVEGLTDPKGMALLNGTLYVADVEGIRVIATDTGTLTETIAVENSMFLNDVAASADTIYVSDTMANVVFSMVPGAAPAVLGAVDYPNGLYVDGDAIYVASFGPIDSLEVPGSISTMAIADGTVTRLGTGEGKFDGIVKHGDRFLVTDFTAKVYTLKADGELTLMADLAAGNGLMSAADLGIDPVANVAMIPDLGGNKVYSVQLP